MDFLYNTARTIWHAFNALPPEVLTQLGQVILTIIIGSPLFILVKKWIVKEREKIMTLVVFIGTVAAGATIFLATSPHTGVWASYTALIATVQGLVSYAAITPFYIFVVKPIYRRANIWFETQVAQAAQLNELKSAAVPTDGLATDQK